VIVHLTFDDILALASDAVAPADVIVRDFGLLQSAVARTQASAFGRDAYPTVALKAAALMESLARNPALVDGNKRLAWLVTMVFCLFNDMIVTAPSVAEGEKFVLAVCQGQLALDDIAHTLLRWS
jgi:death-on-curing protein